MPTSFSVFIKVKLELGLKLLFEVSSVFGKIYNESHLLQSTWVREVGSFLNQVPAFVAELTQVCSRCWATLAGRPGLCCASTWIPWEVSAPHHLSSCSRSITTCWRFFYSDYRCSTSLQKNPSIKIKCFHIKSFDRGMLKTDLPGDCHTKSFSAPSKYSLLLIIHTNERGQWHCPEITVFWF